MKPFESPYLTLFIIFHVSRDIGFTRDLYGVAGKIKDVEQYQPQWPTGLILKHLKSC